jgi:hypothetical protein
VAWFNSFFLISLFQRLLPIKEKEKRKGLFTSESHETNKKKNQETRNMGWSLTIKNILCLCFTRVLIHGGPRKGVRGKRIKIQSYKKMNLRQSKKKKEKKKRKKKKRKEKKEKGASQRVWWVRE